MVSDAAIEKSKNNGYKAREHLSVANKIDELFENANFVNEIADKNGHENIKRLNFEAPVIVGENKAVALITAKKSIDKDLNTIYSLELQEIKQADIRGGKAQTAQKQVINEKMTHALPKTSADKQAFITENSTTTANKSQDPNLSRANPGQKEMRGVYNVTFNDKKATYIKTDLKNVDSAIRYANSSRDKGAKHIKIRHLTDKTKPGYITNEELVNLGNSLREYVKINKEPFIDSNGARIYEWENSDGVRFRAVVDSSRRDETTSELPQPTATDDIITFYSDRNLNEPMNFKNPKLNKDNTISAKTQEPNLSRANPRQKADQYAKWLSQADKIAPQAPDELYKAYDKAKRT